MNKTADKENTLRIAGHCIGEYEIEASLQDETVLYAASELARYVFTAFGAILGISTHHGGRRIVLDIDAAHPADGFTIACKDGDLRISGGSGRGVLYGVYTFLEKFAGWRFFAGEMCIKGTETGQYIARVEKRVTPETSDIPNGYEFSDAPVLHFRDMFGHACIDEDWCAKNRINGDIWRLKNVPKRFGGAERFAANGGHTFNALIPKEKYFTAHPEYYALIDGVRTAGEHAQLCLTAEGLAEEVAVNVIALLDKNPAARYISVSQNDNENFCTCDRCREVERTAGRCNLLFGFINQVADIVAKAHPDVKIHTYAYGSTIGDNAVPLRKNVLLQYCLRSCRTHALDDPACAINVKIAKRLRNAGKRADELFIYDYRSSESHTFLPVPDLRHMRDNMRFLADCRVRGMYAETDIFCANSPCCEELRAYVTAKLMWDPYMSEQTFERHVDEFLCGYYGEGWRHIRNYLDIWERESRYTHFDSVTGIVADNDGKDIRNRGRSLKCRIIRPERLQAVCSALERELDIAYAAAGEAEKPRVEMLYVAPLWYRLYHTMEDIMQTDDGAAKARAVEDNRRLCSLMRRYSMKYTVFIGMTETSEMFHDFTLPPSKWKYWGENDTETVFG